MTEFFDSLSAYNSVLDEKKRLVASASQSKKELLGGDFERPAYDALRQSGLEGLEAQQEQMRQQALDLRAEAGRRSASELARDLPLAVARTGVNLAGGTLALGAKYAPILGEAYSPELQDARNEAVGGISSATHAIDKWLKSGQTALSNRNEDIVARKLALRQEANRELQVEEENQGNSVVAGLRRIGRDLVAGVGETWDNPTTLLNTAVGETATLALGIAGRAGTLARAEGELAKRVGAREAAKVGGDLTGMEQVSENLARQLMRERPAAYIDELAEIQGGMAKNQMAGVIGVSEAGSVYQQTFDQVMSMHPADLMNDSPEFRQLLEKLGDPKEAQRALAASAAQRAAIIQLPIATAAGRVAAGFELNPLSTGVKGGAARQAGAGMLNVLQETGEEVVQGASGSLAQNLGIKTSGADSEQDLLEGVGVNAGVGGITAATMAGGFQVPAVAGGVVTGGVKAAAAVGNVLADRQQRIDNLELDVTHTEEATAGAATINSGLATMAPSFADLSARVTELLTPASTQTSAAQAAIDPSMQVEPQAGDDATMTLLKQTKAYMLRLGQAKTVGDQIPLATVAAQNLRKMEDAITEMSQRLEGMPETDPNRAALVASIAALSAETQSEQAERVRTRFENIGEEELGMAVGWMNDPDSQDLAVELISTLLSIAPDRVTAEAAGKFLEQTTKWSRANKDQLELIVEVDQTQKEASKDMQALAEKAVAASPKTGAHVKSVAEVRQQIETGSFKGKKGLVSHVGDIQRALANNDYSGATKLMEKFAGFVTGLNTRAKSFAETAAKGKANQDLAMLEVPGTQTLDKNNKNKVTNKPFKLYFRSPNSMAVVEASAIDARSAIKAFNYLVRKLPDEMGFEPIDLPARLTPSSAVTPSSGEATQQAATPLPPEGVTASAVVPGPEDNPDVGLEEDTNPDDTSNLFPMPAFTAYFDVPAEVKAEFDNLESEIGWEQRGGLLLRAPLQPNAGALGEVIGRTNWIAKAGPDGQPSVYWRHRANPKGITKAKAFRALSLYRRGLRLGKAQKAFIEESLRYARAVAIERVKATEEAAAQDAFAQEQLALRQARATSAPAAQPTTEATTEVTAPVAAESTAEPEVTEAVTETTVVENKPITTVQERFPTLVDHAVPDTASEQDKRLNKNRLVHGFSLREGSQSLLARLGNNPLGQLQALAAKGMEGLRQLLPKDSKLSFTTDEIRWMQDTFSQNIPAFINHMNMLLKDSVKDTLTNWDATPDIGTKIGWTLPGKMSLYATNINAADLKYDDNVAQAMMLAGMKWAMDKVNKGYPADRQNDVAKFFGISEEDVTREMMLIFQESALQESFIGELANEISLAMGITGNADTTTSVTDGMFRVLAGDVLNTFVSLGLLTSKARQIEINQQENPDEIRDSFDGVEEEEVAKPNTGKNHTVRFVTLAFTKDIKETKTEKGWKGFESMRKELSSGHPNFNILLDPNSRQEWYIGAPPIDVEEGVRGTTQKQSRNQQKITKNHQDVRFELNMEFMDRLIEMGEDKVKELMGFDSIEEPAVNKVHWLTVDGRNHGIQMAWDNMLELRAQMERYAKENDMTLAEVSTHFDWYPLVNGRMMMEGFGPQGDKLFREVLTPVKVAMDMKSARHVFNFKLAIAQALGLKTEYLTNRAAIAQVNEWFGDTETKDEKTLALRGVVAAMLDPDSTPNTVHIALMAYRAVNKNALTMRAINALHSYAGFLQAMSNDAPTYTQSMAFELDGKTDGPIHAMMQFGIWAFNEHIMRHLERGGIFLNRNTPTTLNQMGRGFGDLYGVVAKSMQKNLEKLMVDRKALAEAGDDDSRDILNGLRASTNIFYRLGSIGRTADGLLEIYRDLAKQPVTSTGYGGGVKAIIGDLTTKTLDHLYEELTIGLQDGTPIDKDLQDSINALITTKVEQEWVDGKKILVVYPSGVAPINFSDPLSYQKLELKPAAIRAMQSHFRYGFGRLLMESISTEMGSTLLGMKTVIKSTQVQFTVLSTAYRAAYEELQKQRVAEGVLLKREALSRQDEKVLAKRFEKLMPIFQTAYSLSGNSRNFGFNMIESTKRGKHRVDGKIQQVRSILGGMSADINVSEYQNPGLRGAALFNIAVGDANMMAGFFRMGRQALNVYDGLEISVDAVQESALEINKQVWEGFKFDAFGAANQNYQRALPLILELAAKFPELDPVLFKVITGKPRSLKNKKPVPITEVIEQDAQALAGMARLAAATKQAIMEGPASTDHMGGGENPWVNPGEVKADYIAWVHARAQEILAEKGPPATTIEPTDKTIEAAALAGKAAETGLSRNQIISILDKHQYGKVQKYMYGLIKKLIPNNLVMYVGTQEQMMAAMRRVYPEMPVADISHGLFHGNTIFVVGASPETMLHELVHAATYQLVRRYYNEKLGPLTDKQKKAVSNLEALAREFVNVDTGTEDYGIESATQAAQNTIRRHIENKDMAEAVNEFMAWTSSQNVQKAMERSIPGKLTAILQKVVGALRTLFGLPNDRVVNTWLAQALSNMKTLTEEAERTDLPNTGMSLWQSLDGNNSIHDAHVERVYREFATKVVAATTARANTAEPLSTDLAIDEAMHAFLDAGFEMTERERHSFLMIQQAMSSTMKFNARAMAQVQAMYEAVIPQLTVKSFMVGTSKSDRKLAEAKFKAIMGQGTKKLNSTGQSNLLANFLAMGLVNEQFRGILQDITVPKKLTESKTLNEWVSNMASRLFDWIGSVGLGVDQQASVKSALDVLSNKLYQLEQAAAANRRRDPMEMGNLLMRSGMQVVGDKAMDLYRRRVTGSQQTGVVQAKVDTAIDAFLLGVGAVTTEHGEQALHEAIRSVSNAKKAPLFTWMRDLLTEVQGTTDATEALHLFVNKVKFATAHLRQRLRDELPDHIRSKFTKPLSKAVWKTLYRSLGRSDIQALLGPFEMDEIQRLFAEDAYLVSTIQGLEGRLSGLVFGPEYVAHAKALGSYLTTNDNLRSNGEFLYRNARAMATLAHLSGVKSDRAVAEPLLDQLISLYALQALSAEEKRETALVMATDELGAEYVVRYLQDLASRENGKTDDQGWNRWKGYVPTTFDPRRRLVLADAVKGKELENLGYRRVADYVGDPADHSRLAYYATTVGAMATYNQGAMQTTETSVLGVDYITGRTLDPTMGSMIRNKAAVRQITQAKLNGTGSDGISLIPIFNEDGEIEAYERPLEAHMRVQYLNQVDDLAVSMGQWEGRIQEEELARVFNEKVADELRNIWDTHKGDQEDEFVVINDAKDQRTKGAWDTLPRHVQNYLRQIFAEDGENPRYAKVMVRREMLNNAIGYRSASVSDVFTGASDMHPDLRRGMMGLARGTLGKKAYPFLVNGEKIIQSLVGTAKDVIVVRSLVVGIANAMSNQVQLMLHGISPVEAAKIQARALNEVMTYRRNTLRLNQLRADLAAETSGQMKVKLRNLIESIDNANAKMMIAPLINAGELPSISEGLSEHDEFSLGADFTGWIQDKLEVLPPGVMTAAKWAIIAKDTPLYQGMNRFIQYGDFVAKATVYNHLTKTKGLSSKEAIREVSEEFVNYSLLPGRSRTYLESMGLTWFLAYKLRILKIMLRHIRRNPLRVLMVAGGAQLIGAEHIFKAAPSNLTWNSALGPDQFFRASDAIFWRQMLD